MLLFALATPCVAQSELPDSGVVGPTTYDIAANVAQADLVVVAREVGHDTVPVTFPDGTVRFDMKPFRRIVIEETLKGAPPQGEIGVLGSQITNGTPNPAILFLVRDAEQPAYYRRIGRPRAIFADPWGRAMTHDYMGTPVYLRVGAGGTAVVIDGADPGEELHRLIDDALSAPSFTPNDVSAITLPSRPAERTLTPTQDFVDALTTLRTIIARATDPAASPGSVP